METIHIPRYTRRFTQPFNRTNLEWKRIYRGFIYGCQIKLLIAPIWNGNLQVEMIDVHKEYPFNRTNLEWKHCSVF